MSVPGNRESRLKVFVHYSSADIEFADWLVAELTKLGYLTLSDRRDIEINHEVWIERLQDLVLDCDAIVFVVSPHSIRSDISSWVIDEAKGLGKRIVPLVLDPTVASSIPKQLAGLEAVPFYSNTDASDAMDSLAHVLDSNSSWSRQHTHIGQLAHRWINHSRDPDYLLRGRALDESLAWVNARPPAGAELTVRQVDFLRESKHWQSRSSWWSMKRSRATIALRPHPRPLGKKIFISYRREDSKHVAGRIFDRLKDEFPINDIFFDVDAIPIGVEFETYLRDAIGESAVVLALVGPRWTKELRKRERWWAIGPPKEDFVRAEIERALDYGVPLIPILIDEAKMPTYSQVPTTLREFRRINATPVRDGRDFYGDMGAVIDRIRPLRASVTATGG